ncbi:MAG: exosortase/archaeosortase family protein [Phycisphaerales bacterium]
MSGAATSSTGGLAAPSKSGGGADAFLSRLLTAPNVVMMVVLLGGLVGLFWEWFYRQHRFSAEKPEDWGHAYLVPLISAFAIWSRRAELSRLKPEVYWPGLLPLAVGVGAHYFWSLSPAPGTHMFQGAALVLCVAGLSLLLLGPRIFAVIAFPIAYLAFGVTISEMVMNKITFQLQMIATNGSAVLLQMLGFTVDLKGNTVTLTLSDGSTMPLNVAEACSGMRMVVAFVALAVAVAFLSTRLWWQRVALVLLATPVAVLTNVVRVASLGVAGVISPGLATGEAHALIGVLWLVPGFLLFMGIGWSLKKMVQSDAPKGAKA